MIEKKYDLVCLWAVATLGDLLKHTAECKAKWLSGEMTPTQYLGYMQRYKALRDALYHAGYLPDNWDDNDLV